MGTGLVNESSTFQGTYYKYYSHTTTIQTSDGQVLNPENLFQAGGPAYGYSGDVMLPNFTNCNPD